MIYCNCLQWPKKCDFEMNAVLESGAPNENIVQNHLNIALLNVF